MADRQEQLTALELYRSEPDPGDGRASLVTIAKVGEHLIDEERELLDFTQERIVSDFSDDEIETGTRILEVVLRQIAATTGADYPV